jgi:hypothetical protein
MILFLQPILILLGSIGKSFSSYVKPFLLQNNSIDFFFVNTDGEL